MKIRNALLGLLVLAFSATATAARKEVVLNPQHPDRYVVAAGDTLWGVATKFLRDPWQWPELWDSDSKATRRLRPGDVLTLTEVNGKPRLQLSSNDGDSGASPAAPVRRPGDPLPVVKLSPHARVTNMQEHIPVIPLTHVRAFLSSPKVVSEKELEDAPYLLEFPDNRRFVGAGDKVYVRGLKDNPLSTYGVFHKGSAYEDGDSGEDLGYEAIHAGDARLAEEGDPAIFILANTQREAKVGDRLLELDEELLPTNYEPHAPNFELKGHIINFLGSENIGLRGGMRNVGQYAVVVLDRGTHDGLEQGHVLDIYQKGRHVSDNLSGRPYDSAVLPEEIVGSVLIFRVFDRVSFGLVMAAEHELKVGDVVRAPY